MKRLTDVVQQLEQEVFTTRQLYRQAVQNNDRRNVLVYANQLDALRSELNRMQYIQSSLPNLSEVV